MTVTTQENLAHASWLSQYLAARGLVGQQFGLIDNSMGLFLNLPRQRAMLVEVSNARDAPSFRNAANDVGKLSLWVINRRASQRPARQLMTHFDILAGVFAVVHNPLMNKQIGAGLARIVASYIGNKASSFPPCS
jgi:hypothetical protein